MTQSATRAGVGSRQMAKVRTHGLARDRAADLRGDAWQAGSCRIDKVPSPTFQSFSQNGEDVVLRRALNQIDRGRYVEVGANHPEIFSVTRAFYELGWSGILVEPDPEFARMQRAQRPRDRVVEAAITVKDGSTTTLHVVDGTGLSTLDPSLAYTHGQSGYETHDIEVSTRRLDSILEEAGWQREDIHFMSVDTEGSEPDVLESCNFQLWRPWILVVEATAPLSTESTREAWEHLVLGAGYEFCLFDGLSCFYVAKEHAEALRHALSYPACVLDDYTTREYREVSKRLETIPRLTKQVSRWRNQALARWATAISSQAEMDQLLDDNARLERDLHEARIECARLHQSVYDLLHSTSWRASKPLRLLGYLIRKAGRLR